MRKTLAATFAAAALLATVPVTAVVASTPPFPLGVCFRSTLVSPNPICVMVDPA